MSGSESWYPDQRVEKSRMAERGQKSDKGSRSEQAMGVLPVTATSVTHGEVIERSSFKMRPCQGRIFGGRLLRAGLIVWRSFHCLHPTSR